MTFKSSNSKPRLFQFSLRTLIVVVVVTATYFGGREPLRRELEATKRELQASLEKEADAKRRASYQLYLANIQLAKQQLQNSPPRSKELVRQAIESVKRKGDIQEENEHSPPTEE